MGMRIWIRGSWGGRHSPDDRLHVRDMIAMDVFGRSVDIIGSCLPISRKGSMDMPAIQFHARV